MRDMQRNVLVIWSWKRFAATILALILLSAALVGFGVYRHMKKAENASIQHVLSMSYSVRGV